MTVTDNKKPDDPEIHVTPVVTASVVEPGKSTYTKTGGNALAGPAGTAGNRFYCEKCHAPYDLPERCTSWRCPNCSTFNSTTVGECPWCTIQ
mmetsp:Transcript_23260/g.33953  ORF Transcript_23260/g.33953 Transcript_23260/m.33953 type:complete len:92 (-) Transcript_23260:1494-1769(-)